MPEQLRINYTVIASNFKVPSGRCAYLEQSAQLFALRLFNR